MSQRKNESGEEKPKSQFQVVKEGWYEKLVDRTNLTTKKLDVVIVLCLITLVVSLTIGYVNRGYTVEFNSLGGTTVESQKLQYGDLVVVDEPPTREGYVFAGWYRDIMCENPWNLETDTVEQSMTLYAAWEEKTE